MGFAVVALYAPEIRHFPPPAQRRVSGCRTVAVHLATLKGDGVTQANYKWTQVVRSRTACGGA